MQKKNFKQTETPIFLFCFVLNEKYVAMWNWAGNIEMKWNEKKIYRQIK